MEYAYEFPQKQEKTEIGPELRQVEIYQVTARNTLFANDGRESSKNMGTLKITSKAMVTAIENQMITNRLVVNATKTQVMCLRTKQKRIQIIKKGGKFDLELTIKGKQIPKQKKVVVLGLNWDRDMGWTGHVEQVLEKYNKQVGA